MIEQASKLLDVKEKLLKEFKVLDFFNHDNELEGVLCIQADHRYGALVIFKVNGQETGPQVIYCTPKLHYPFSTNEETEERKFHWQKADEFHIYDKLDGTNVNVYRYLDASGKAFVTYKTRLTPVLQESKFGNFRGMWTELMLKHPGLCCPAKVLSGEYTFSFEMYGYKNLVLAIYKEPIAAKFLFAINQKTGLPCPPTKDLFDSDLINEPKAWWNQKTEVNIDELYNEYREIANKENQKIPDTILCEGYVFYTRHGDEWKLWKCKPPQVEDIHWTSDIIDAPAIFTTAKNALENYEPDNLTPDIVAELLAEEFEDHKIKKSWIRIEKVTKAVVVQAKFSKKVRDVIEQCPQEILESKDKKIIMPWVSQHFERQEMKKVFQVLNIAGFV